jgi:3-oxoacyl-[acyl-carrier protein] reductase
MKFKGKVVLVTGAGSGIGKATALLFAEEGAHTIIADIDLSAANQTVEIIRTRGHRSLAVKVDISNENEVKNIIHTSIQEFGGLHVLVNSAGIACGGPTVDFPLVNFDRTLNVNLRGTFLCCQMAGRWMERNKGGTIVNIASTAGIAGVEGGAAYGASKAGIINITRSLAKEWAKNNIRVNAVAPSFVLTPMLAEDSLKEISKSVPLGRVSEPEEIARTILFLASDDASYITGSILVVDGGLLS